MDYEFYEEVKAIIGQGGNTYQDDTLRPIVYEVLEDMIDSGVPRVVAYSKKAVGTVAIGVNDLWDYTSGAVKHSPYFLSRCVKLSYMTEEDVADKGEIEEIKRRLDELEKVKPEQLTEEDLLEVMEILKTR